MTTTHHQPTPPPDEQDRLQAEIATLRDRILGALRPGEDLETYRLRSYQALRQATEIVHSDHQPEIDGDEDDEISDDPILTGYHSNLDLIATTLNQPIDD